MPPKAKKAKNTTAGNTVLPNYFTTNKKSLLKKVKEDFNQGQATELDNKVSFDTLLTTETKSIIKVTNERNFFNRKYTRLSIQSENSLGGPSQLSEASTQDSENN